MELIYTSEKVRLQCTNAKEARKQFGGDRELTISLLARINAMEAADTIKDIIVQPAFHFHRLSKKKRNLQGWFAIDVKTRKEQWRVIFRPLDEEGEPYVPCNIDEIAETVKRVEIAEVSKHYE